MALWHDQPGISPIDLGQPPSRQQEPLWRHCPIWADVLDLIALRPPRMDVVSDASSGQARIKPAAQERIETVASLAEGWAAASECVSEVHAGHHSRQGQRLHRVLSVLGASEQRAHHCQLPAQRAPTKEALRAPPPRGPGGSGFAAGPTGLPSLPRPRRHDLGDRRWGLCRPGDPPPVGPPWPMLPGLAGGQDFRRAITRTAHSPAIV